ncbi:MAG: AtpZ/AtpI family protein [Deltaproteobacteria bacterium]|nr:AtpZ/AtpI family protein [Deltaproteobacteria bacterium]
MKKGNKSTILEMAYASSLGIAMVIAVFGSLFIGAYLDRKFGTRNIFTILFLVVGVVAGFRNYYLFFKRYLPDSEERPSSTAKKPRSDGKITITKKD